jgi:hypothetical protein
MAGPLEVAVGISGSGHHRTWRRRWRAPGVLSRFPAAATIEHGDVNGGPLGVLSGFPVAATTEAKDVDGRPLGGAGGRADIGHHRSWRRQWWAPWGCCWDVRQQPPLKGRPRGVAGGRSGSGHHQS